MNILLCKLIDGSYVLGDADADNLKDCFEVLINHTEQGIQVAFAPMMYPFNQKLTGISIPMSKVLVSIAPPQDMQDQYIKNTSGIIPATTIPSHLKTNLSVVK